MEATFMSQISVSRRRNKEGWTGMRRAARRRYMAACVEKLEERTLLSAITGTTGMKSATFDGFQAVGAAYDTNGALWMSAIDSLGGAEFGLTGPGNTFTPVYTDAHAVEFDGLVAGPNGTLYFINLAANSIMKYDPSVVVVEDRVSTLWASVPNALQQITGLTVSGSDVWFYMNSTSDNTQYGHVNMIGRVDPTGSMTPLTLSGDPVLRYTDVVGLSAVHLEIATNTFVEGVYVGFKGVDYTATHPNQSAPVGQSAVGVAYLSGASIAFSYAVPTGSDPVYQYGELTSITTDPRDGSVWFAMGPGVSSQKPQHPASAIVHGTLTATWDGFADLASYTVQGATAGDNMRLMSLAFDGNGDLYFAEYARAKVGFLDTNIVATVSDVSTAYSVSGLQDLVVDPGDQLTPPTIESTAFPMVVAVNPVLPPTTDDVAATVVAGTGYTWLSVHADIVVVTPPEVEFDGSAGFGGAVNEDTLLHQAIAVFTAQTGNYVATIDWGDGTAPVTVAAELLNPDVPNVYVVYVDKKFARQSPTEGFAGTVLIHEINGLEEDHLLTMSTVVSDTALVASAISITTLLSRIATLSMSFTDDVDSKVNNFDVSINWGDGSTSKGAVLKDPTTPGRYFVLGIHVYKKRGTYNVTATITGNEEGLMESAVATKTLVL